MAAPEEADVILVSAGGPTSERRRLVLGVLTLSGVLLWLTAALAPVKGIAGDRGDPPSSPLDGPWLHCGKECCRYERSMGDTDDGPSVCALYVGITIGVVSTSERRPAVGGLPPHSGVKGETATGRLIVKAVPPPPRLRLYTEDGV